MAKEDEEAAISEFYLVKNSDVRVYNTFVVILPWIGFQWKERLVCSFSLKKLKIQILFALNEIIIVVIIIVIIKTYEPPARKKKHGI